MKTFRTKPTTQQVRQFNKKALTIRRLRDRARTLEATLKGELEKALTYKRYLDSTVSLVETKGLIEDMKKAWWDINSGEF
jgi:hypothetical protein